MDCYYVYIACDTGKTGLRVGLTRDLSRCVSRLRERRPHAGDAAARLVYYEITLDIDTACRRERQIRSWRRERREDLVGSMNPQWDDLASKW